MPPAKRPSRSTKAIPAADGLLAAAPEGSSAAPPPAAALESILGHQDAVTTLTRALAAGRVHHAFIFHGPAGVGKFTTALAFAARLLAIEPAAVRNHPDLHVITKELASLSRESEVRKRKQSNIPREVLLQFLLEPAAVASMCGLRPGAAASKVFIVDQAEMMDDRGQNTLLKTLEEPAPGTVIILVTSEEAGLLATIRSRCQRIGFGPLDQASMQHWLEASGLSVPAEQRQWLIWHAQGSPGALLVALKSDLFACHQQLEPLLAPTDGGAPPAATLGSVLAEIVESRAKQVVEADKLASKDAANRAWAYRLLGFLAHRYADRLRAPSEISRARALSALRLLRDAEQQIESNVRFADVAENFAAQLGAS